VAAPWRPAQTSDFEQACSTLQALLAGSFRHELCDTLSQAATLGDALSTLRRGMETHCWTTAGAQTRLAVIRDLDARTRGEGFHALHDWDGIRDGVNPSIIPIDVLDFIAREHGGTRCSRSSIAILLDYYFLYLLSLLSLRIWDAGDADGNLETLAALLSDLQGPHGSTHRFVDDAATLLLVATSHYEIEERGFGSLLERVRTLATRHQEAIALGHAAAMGCHLRFGFDATYGHSVAAMRADNVADYPWLAFSLLVLVRQYERLLGAGVDDAACARVIEAIVNALSGDPGAFAGGEMVDGLWASEDESREWATLIDRHRRSLAGESESLKPDECIYSPLGFFFNFSQNVLKAAVVDAVLWGEPARLSLNDLFTGVAESEADAVAKARRAAILAQYAQARPDPIAGRLQPVIVYDPVAGRRAFDRTLALLSSPVSR
jgi:hypothetical protein